MHYNNVVLFTRSADKWGVPHEDSLRAAVEPVRVIEISADPYKELRVGFGRDGSPLEVVIDFDRAPEPTVIHAMPLRRSYYPLLPGYRRGRRQS